MLVSFLFAPLQRMPLPVTSYLLESRSAYETGLLCTVVKRDMVGADFESGDPE